MDKQDLSQEIIKAYEDWKDARAAYRRIRQLEREAWQVYMALTKRALAESEK